MILGPRVPLWVSVCFKQSRFPLAQVVDTQNCHSQIKCMVGGRRGCVWNPFLPALCQLKQFHYVFSLSQTKWANKQTLCWYNSACLLRYLRAWVNLKLGELKRVFTLNTHGLKYYSCLFFMHHTTQICWLIILKENEEKIYKQRANKSKGIYFLAK
jgi:hypothetical protein